MTAYAQETVIRPGPQLRGHGDTCRATSFGTQTKRPWT